MFVSQFVVDIDVLTVLQQFLQILTCSGIWVLLVLLESGKDKRHTLAKCTAAPDSGIATQYDSTHYS